VSHPSYSLRWRAIDVGFIVLSWSVLYLTLLTGWYQAPNGIWGVYSLVDGRWAAWNAEFIFRWGRFLDPSPFNIFSGMGSMFLPNLPWLNPGAWPLGLPITEMHRFALSNTIYLVEISASIVLLARVLGLSWVLSHVAAQLHALFLFPPLSAYFASLPWYSLAPVNAHLAAVANCLLATTLRLGSSSHRGNLQAGVTMLLLCVIGILSAPMTFPTYLPVYGLFAVVLTAAKRPTASSLGWKVGTWLVIACVLALAFGEYYRGTIETSARSMATPSAVGLSAFFSPRTWAGLLGYDVCEAPQTLLCARYRVIFLKWLALAGACWWIAYGARWQRITGGALLVLEFFLYGYQSAAQLNLLGLLHVVSADYLMWSSYTVYAIFAAVAMSILFVLWQRRVFGTAAPRPYTEWFHRGLLVVVPACALLISVHSLELRIPPFKSIAWRHVFAPRAYEPAVTPIISYLIEHAALKPGALFRGYEASYFADPRGFVSKAVDAGASSSSLQRYIDARAYLEKRFGNSFIETDLWKFSIPTFEEYGQWVSRQSFALMRALLAGPADTFHPSFLRVYRLDIALLQALGVRYLITDIDVSRPEAVLVMTETVAPGETIRLYEFPRPNLATYSPTIVIESREFPQTIELLSQNAKLLASHVVLTRAVRPPLVPAKSAIMRAEPDGVRITAESDGRSLLLVPIQFSHCLSLSTIATNPSSATPRLMRANLIQTALEFDRRVDAVIELRFGLFSAGRCRKADAADLDALGVR